jgi:hypothetical protein
MPAVVFRVQDIVRIIKKAKMYLHRSLKVIVTRQADVRLDDGHETFVLHK